MARPLWASGILRAVPRWLTRVRAARLLQGIGDFFDAESVKADEAVRARFPRAEVPSALPYIGRERRIRRGPGETGATYASRLLRWWDAHRARGSAYEMLRQLRDFWRASPEVEEIHVVAHSGRRHWVDMADADTFTRDSVAWLPGPIDEWAHVWVFLYTDGPPDTASTLVTHAGDILVTHLGDDLVAITDLSGGGALAEEEAELYRAVPREWSAGHIPYVTVVLRWGDGWLLGYPPGIELGDPGLVLGGDDTPIVLIAE